MHCQTSVGKEEDQPPPPFSKRICVDYDWDMPHLHALCDSAESMQRNTGQHLHLVCLRSSVILRG